MELNPNLQKRKLRIFKLNVLSVLHLYGCKTQNITERIASSIQVYVNKCLRRIHMTRQPNIISNGELRRHSNIKKLDIQIKRRKWNWIDHALHKPGSTTHQVSRDRQRITKAAMNQNPLGKRKWIAKNCVEVKCHY